MARENTAFPAKDQVFVVLIGQILAAAGLGRLGLGDRIHELIEPSISLHAVGQGALGIECRDVRTGRRQATAACGCESRVLSAFWRDVSQEQRSAL